MLPTLRCRSMRRDDAGTCADWLAEDCIPAANGGTGEKNGNRASTLARLIDEERIQGVIVESHDLDNRRWTAQGIGLSGFARPEIVDRHLARPTPYFLHQILELCSAPGSRALLDPDDQARINASNGPGMDVVAQWMQKRWELMDPLWRAVGSMAHEAYVRDHRGHRIHRMFHEDWLRAFDIYPTFGYRAHTTFELADSSTKPAAGRGITQRTLYYMDTREIAGAAPGTSASFVLQHIAPVCQFTRAEQRLLRKAIEGLTDQQIAAELGLSVNTLKSTWRSIYDRVASHAPYVLSGMDGSGEDGGVRGTEKRRGVLSFVESHPQELRPYLKTA